MRVLVTCDRYPVSLQDGLVLRLRHLVTHLQGRHEFDLVCLDRNPAQHCAELDRLFVRLQRVPYGPPPQRRGWSRVAATLDSSAHYPASGAAAAAISGLLAERPYDLVWDAGANMLNPLAELLRSADPPLLADQVDDAFVRLQREWQLTRGVRQGLSLFQQWLLERQFARRHLARAATVLFVSTDDEASFRRVCPRARTAAIANGVDALHFTRRAELPREEPQTLVFEGAMDFAPNVDAALYFAQAVLPLIRARRPEVRWLLVGREPTQAVRELANSGVEVSGSVPDVRPWLSRAGVFVCPMRAGAGIKNKILQAWAMGLPVVSTSVGAQGLAAQDGVNVLIAETPLAFAQAVLKMLDNPDLARSLGEAGRATVLQRYAWRRKAQELELLFETMVGDRR